MHGYFGSNITLAVASTASAATASSGTGAQPSSGAASSEPGGDDIAPGGSTTASAETGTSTPADTANKSVDAVKESSYTASSSRSSTGGLGTGLWIVVAAVGGCLVVGLVIV